MTLSDLTATPPDQPTALCEPLMPSFENSDLFDQAYIEDWIDSSSNPRYTGNTSRISDSELRAVNGNWPNYRKGIDDGFLDVTISPSAAEAESMPWLNYSGGSNADPNILGWTLGKALVSLVREPSAPDVTTFSFAFGNPREINFLTYVYLVRSGGSNLPLTTQIVIGADDGQVFRTRIVDAQANYVAPVGNTIPQPAANFTKVLDLEIAHVATLPSSRANSDISWQAKLIGIQLPNTINIASVDFLFEDLDEPVPSGERKWVGNMYGLWLAKKTVAYQEVFPLPEGCVVPTPA